MPITIMIKNDIFYGRIANDDFIGDGRIYVSNQGEPPGVFYDFLFLLMFKLPVLSVL